MKVMRITPKSISKRKLWVIRELFKMQTSFLLLNQSYWRTKNGRAGSRNIVSFTVYIDLSLTEHSHGGNSEVVEKQIDIVKQV